MLKHDNQLHIFKANNLNNFFNYKSTESTLINTINFGVKTALECKE